MALPLWEECSWNKGLKSNKNKLLNDLLGESTKQKPVEIDLLSFDPVEDTNVPVFPINDKINAKMHLHLGQSYKVPCDVLVLGQNEQLADRTEDNEGVFMLAGPSFEAEVSLSAPIQTGESVMVEGGYLSSPWVVFSVGPRYDTKYLTASDHALFSAYKSALLLAAEKNAKSVVFSCIYSEKKKFPRMDAAHVALRTIRKFLNHASMENVFEKIMLCVPSQDDYEIYSALMTAYFPRTRSEVDNQQTLLPTELGDEWGECKVAERSLKVSMGPKPLPVEQKVEYKRRMSESDLGTYQAASSSANAGSPLSSGKAGTTGPKKTGML
jgi:O-acetyl-ADP-ribose deacetylase (regulator of RNase III)